MATPTGWHSVVQELIVKDGSRDVNISTQEFPDFEQAMEAGLQQTLKLLP
jgi:hypothetical protein